MAASQIKDYYKILQVDIEADLEVIQGAYKRLAAKWHPDKNPGNEAYASERMKELNKAYEVLSDPSQRRKYNEERESRIFSPSPEETRKAKVHTERHYSTYGSSTARGFEEYKKKELREQAIDRQFIKLRRAFLGRKLSGKFSKSILLGCIVPVLSLVCLEMLVLALDPEGYIGPGSGGLLMSLGLVFFGVIIGVGIWIAVHLATKRPREIKIDSFRIAEDDPKWEQKLRKEAEKRAT